MESLQELTDLCSRVFITWSMESYGLASKITDEEKERADILEKGKIAYMVYNKLKAFNVPVELPNQLLILIELMACGNPGHGQLIVYEILTYLKGRGKLHPGITISPDDCALLWGSRFPIYINPEVQERFEKMWSEQKDRTGHIDNKIDSSSYWLQLFQD